MDFTKVISAASKNEQAAKKNLNKTPALKTDFKSSSYRPREEKKPKGVQSAAVQAFLKKQADEEKQKAEEAKRKKAALIAARVEANTAKTARAMASRTKDNLKVFDFGGRTEDLNKKTSAAPKEEPTEELDTISFGSKRRVAHMSDDKILAARKVILKEAEQKKAETQKRLARKEGEDLWNVQSDDETGKVEIKCEVILPQKDRSSKLHNGHHSSSKHSAHKDKHKEKHRRDDKHRDKHRHKHRESKESADPKPKVDVVEKKEKPKPKPIKRNQGPPPMSFSQLMALAESNKDKPVDEVSEKVPEKKKEGEHRLMTQEEKERLARRQSKEYQHWLKFGGKLPSTQNGQSKDSKTPSSKDSREPVASKAAKPASSENRSSQENGRAPPAKPSLSQGKERSASEKMRQLDEERRNRMNGSSKMESKSHPLSQDKPRPSSLGDKRVAEKGSRNPSSGNYDRVSESILECGKSRGSKRGVEESDQEDEKPVSTWDKIYGKIQKSHPKPAKRPRVVESDEEGSGYEDDFIDDEEDMDDFIDDSEAVDYSSYIRDIFGYDKRKFRHEREEDLSDMETSFAQISHEEARSARIGRQEDLEDIRMEEEEKKRKMMRKKQLLEAMRAKKRS